MHLAETLARILQHSPLKGLLHTDPQKESVPIEPQKPLRAVHHFCAVCAHPLTHPTSFGKYDDVSFALCAICAAAYKPENVYKVNWYAIAQMVRYNLRDYL